MWRLYVEKGTDPVVIERTWTLRTVLDANDALDLQMRANKKARDKSRAKEGN